MNEEVKDLHIPRQMLARSTHQQQNRAERTKSNSESSSHLRFYDERMTNLGNHQVEHIGLSNHF